MQHQQRQQEGDFDDLRHVGIMMAAMIALGGFFATWAAGIIPYIGWALCWQPSLRLSANWSRTAISVTI